MRAARQRAAVNILSHGIGTCHEKYCQGGTMTKCYVEATSGADRSDDNVRRIGEFETRDEAIACARRVIDAFLLAKYQTEMYPRELLALYLSAGDQPSIFQDDD